MGVGGVAFGLNHLCLPPCYARGSFLGVMGIQKETWRMQREHTDTHWDHRVLTADLLTGYRFHAGDLECTSYYRLSSAYGLLLLLLRVPSSISAVSAFRYAAEHRSDETLLTKCAFRLTKMSIVVGFASQVTSGGTTAHFHGFSEVPRPASRSMEDLKKPHLFNNIR